MELFMPYLGNSGAYCKNTADRSLFIPKSLRIFVPLKSK